MIMQYLYHKIQIDKEGIWYFCGAEMIRRDIVHYFYQHLKSDAQGSFYIEIEDERCSVGVEDVPYVIKSVDLVILPEDGRHGFLLSLSDGNTEILNFDNNILEMSNDNILYCRIRNGDFEARFSRPAYYQLCEYIEYDPIKEKYFVNINDHFIPIGIYNKT